LFIKLVGNLFQSPVLDVCILNNVRLMFTSIEPVKDIIHLYLVGGGCWTRVGALCFLLPPVFFYYYYLFNYIITNSVVMITFCYYSTWIPTWTFISRFSTQGTLFTVMKFQITKTTTNHYMAYAKETSKPTAAAYLPFYTYTL